MKMSRKKYKYIFASYSHEKKMSYSTQQHITNIFQIHTIRTKNVKKNPTDSTSYGLIIIISNFLFYQDCS